MLLLELLTLGALGLTAPGRTPTATTERTLGGAASAAATRATETGTRTAATATRAATGTARASAALAGAATAGRCAGTTDSAAAGHHLRRRTWSAAGFGTGATVRTPTFTTAAGPCSAGTTRTRHPLGGSKRVVAGTGRAAAGPWPEPGAVDYETLTFA